MSLKEKEVFVVGVRNFKAKDSSKQYFVVDYVVVGNWTPKTDFISAIEYENIKKKLADNHVVNAIGSFDLNDFDKLYLSDIEL